jgi:hypothetical protein
MLRRRCHFRAGMPPKMEHADDEDVIKTFPSGELVSLSAYPRPGVSLPKIKNPGSVAHSNKRCHSPPGLDNPFGRVWVELPISDCVGEAHF